MKLGTHKRESINKFQRSSHDSSRRNSTMVGGEQYSAINRLKREHCNRTKHDSNFSPWKILIGPSDWEDYSKGKEGSTRYRIHNLPQKSGPGVYELGIAVSSGGLGPGIYKLAPDRIVVVYLGQADDVRARLQRYGRSGAHLGNGCLESDDSNDAYLQKGRPLFQEIFSQGYPIVYRWAPIQNKEDAKQTEAQLLSTFDYAWNTSSNGARRPDDILQKLNKIALGSRTFSDMTKVLLPFTQRKVGIRIKSSKLSLTDDRLDEEDNGSYSFLSRVFTFNRSRPRKVQDIVGIPPQENATICGLALGDGSVCRRPPVKNRKRCPEHKGMRTTMSTPKVLRAPKSESIAVLDPNVYCQTKDNGSINETVSHDVEGPLKTDIQSPVESISNTNICGIILNDGSICRRPPVKGRKRCQEHKGKRICAPKSERPEPDAYCQTKGNDYRGQNVGHGVEALLRYEIQSPADVSNSIICGIILNDGSTCRRQPVKGRKRCHEHKGRRIRASIHISQK